MKPFAKGYCPVVSARFTSKLCKLLNASRARRGSGFLFPVSNEWYRLNRPLSNSPGLSALSEAGSVFLSCCQSAWRELEHYQGLWRGIRRCACLWSLFVRHTAFLFTLTNWGNVRSWSCLPPVFHPDIHRLPFYQENADEKSSVWKPLARCCHSG